MLLTGPRRDAGKAAASAGTLRLACCALLLACPQLLEDEFRDRTDPGGAGQGGAAAGVGGVASSGSGGTAGTGAGGGRAGGGGSTFSAAGTAGSSGTTGNAGAAGATGERDATDPGDCVSHGEFTAPEPLGNLGRTGTLWGPNLSRDGLTLAFAEELNGAEEVFVATRVPGGPFGGSMPVAGVNSPASEGTPFFVAATSVYFYSNRGGGAGGRDLYVASRPMPMGPFGPAAPVAGVNTAANEHLPWVSPDELTIYFASTRSGTTSSDIYTGTRASPSGVFTDITSVAALNSASADESPALSADGLTIVFSSSRTGDFDIWMASRSSPTATFGSLGGVPELNTSSYESNVTLSSDGLEVIFVSDRDGDTQLYRATRECL